MKLKKICALFMCMIIIIQYLPVFGANNTVELSTESDFEEFAKKATLDKWSEGKRVILKNDINITGSGCPTVPIFGGIFEGNGYTITVNYTKKGSAVGLFRYINKGGAVRNLNVKGTVMPDGSKERVGGICGENRGTVENCYFEGEIKGGSITGGIAGLNNGDILGCGFTGKIHGDSKTGGICGKNSGRIQKSVNDGEVNTTLDGEPDYTYMDFGGIAGFSNGIIQGCTNNGAVGYSSTGFNVGGVCGRQSGYMLGNVNNGAVYGRRDVGGICGQAEPYVLLTQNDKESIEERINDFIDFITEDIKPELEALSDCADKARDDLDDISDKVGDKLDGISDYAGKAMDSADTMADQLTDFADDKINVLNDLSAELSDTMDKLIPVFDDVSDSMDGINDAMEDIQSALNGISISDPETEKAIDYFDRGIGNINGACVSIKEAIRDMQDAVNILGNVVTYKDEKAAKEAREKIISAIETIYSGKRTIKKELNNIIESVKGTQFDAVVPALQAIGEAITEDISSLTDLKNYIPVLVDNTEIDLSQIKRSFYYFDRAVDMISASMSQLSRGMSGLKDAVDELDRTIGDWADDTEEQLDKARDGLSNGADDLKFAVEALNDGIKSIKKIIKDMNEDDPYEMTVLGDDFKSESDNLFDSIDRLSDEIDAMKTTISDGGDILSDDLNDISSRFDKIMDMITDRLNNNRSENDLFEKFDKEDFVSDVSEDQIKSTKEGKISGCVNHGEAYGDSNVGGVVGTVAIQPALEEETELEKPSAFNFMYETKAVIYECVNNGKVSSKKNNTGGIAGLMMIGTAYGCESYGGIESEGSYAGGICGRSYSGVLKCYAKTDVTGTDHVGGICGMAKKSVDCRSIVDISGEEFIGAVLGEREDNEEVRGNYYVDNGMGAVDGVSYSGIAEGISYEAMSRLEGIPKSMMSFNVRFVADGNVVDNVVAFYGDCEENIKAPTVPEKSGYYGEWQIERGKPVVCDIEIEAEYRKWLSVIASEEKTGELSDVLVEGQFKESSRVVVRGSDEKPPEEGETVVWSIEIYDDNITDSTESNIRLINPEKKKADVYELKDGEWQKLEIKERGRYLVCSVMGKEPTVCIVYGAKHIPVWIIISASALLAAAVVIFTIKHRGKKENRKTEAAAEITEEP